jgi:hypothetical protein
MAGAVLADGGCGGEVPDAVLEKSPDLLAARCKAAHVFAPGKSGSEGPIHDGFDMWRRDDRPSRRRALFR